ncbi:cell division protein ZipA [Veronia pacifica]|uniref:Cell division protein ZipA n=1 Tax=Veronia pacifica TaxID=1080227 RepID=A0A1C3EEM9_9GAMM|nr:cell division protein ZipA [Veronia pacifica]ODA31698.1 cell division protein ZipA [Veronia pacifica]
MMQELRLVLIVLGALVIAALIIHGLWSSRKERPEKFGDKPLGKLKGEKQEDSTESFDDDGIGAVRVIKGGTDKPEAKQRKEPGLSFDESSESDIDPLFADFKDDIDTAVPSNNAATAESNTLGEVTDAVEVSSEVVTDPLPEEEVETAAPEPKQQVLIVNVQASANSDFNGVDLMNSLEQNGMIHGEMDIFHRHADLSGTGKVLFSAANMYNPGSFPMENISQFTTEGISFFMTLPCYGDPEHNFKLMLQTAQKVADQLGGLVTDDARNLMTPQRLDGYRDQVKSFSEPA